MRRRRNACLFMRFMRRKEREGWRGEEVKNDHVFPKIIKAEREVRGALLSWTLPEDPITTTLVVLLVLLEEGKPLLRSKSRWTSVRKNWGAGKFEN